MAEDIAQYALERLENQAVFSPQRSQSFSICGIRRIAPPMALRVCGAAILKVTQFVGWRVN
jgi:hypothetical protein